MTIKIDETTVEVDGVRYKREEEEQGWMPRPGQLIQVRDRYWMNWQVAIFEEYCEDATLKWSCRYDSWNYARPITDDKLLIGRTFAPEGAKWFAPFAKDKWAWFASRPKEDGVGWYGLVGGGDCVKGTITLPTNDRGEAPIEAPIKLWEDEE